MLSSAAHAYPPDLAARTEERWSSLPFAAPLPPRALLHEILSTAYQASLLRDEERPVTLRLLFADPSALPIEAGPPSGLLRLAFDRPRPFTVEELQRLSPAARYHRALVGVRVGDEGRLEIWGIAQSGPRWLQGSHGGRATAALLPERLVVRVTGPGRLFVACGSVTVAGLQGGHITDGAMDVFESRWLPARFARLRGEVAELHREAARAAEVPWGEVDPDVVRMVAQQMVKRVVANIRDTHHGGLVLLLPPWSADAIAQGRHLQLKYACRDEEPRRRYRTLVLAVMRVLAQEMGRVPTHEVADWSDYRRWNTPELAALDEAILEMAHLIASLAGVDGAVVLTQRFELLGFGGEITGDLPEVTTVERALDLEATRCVAEVVNAMGTRHRSAYRLCARFPEALAIVVSQDGGVRFVGWHEGAVTYWDHTTLGAEDA
jgi:hypothetical protein